MPVQILENFGHKINEFRSQNSNIMTVCIGLGIAGLALSAYSMSGFKYERIEYCFNPPILEPRNRPNYCTDDKTYIMPTQMWAKRGSIPRNQKFQPEGAFLMPEKATRLRTLDATNPQSWRYSLASSFFLMGSVSLIGMRIKKYKENFPMYFELVKRGLNKAVIDSESEVMIYNQDVNLKTKRKLDELSQEDELERWGDKPEAQQEAEIAQERKQAEMNNELVDTTHLKTMAQLKADAAEAQLKENQALRKIKPINGNNSVTETKVDEQAIAEVKQALKEWEDGWLWQVTDSLVPLWLIGKAGSGKTYTANAFAIIRKYCFGHPIYQVFDRHYTGDNLDAWKFIEPENAAESDAEMIKAFGENPLRWLKRIKDKNKITEQVIIDEFTTLKDSLGDVVSTFYKLHLTDCRKAKVQVIGITHNDTNGSYPSGTKDMREAGTILIRKYSKNGRTPLSRITLVRGLVNDEGDEQVDVKKSLPPWFHPEKLYDHFTGKKSIDFNHQEIDDTEISENE